MRPGRRGTAWKAPSPPRRGAPTPKAGLGPLPSAIKPRAFSCPRAQLILANTPLRERAGLASPFRLRARRGHVCYLRVKGEPVFPPSTALPPPKAGVCRPFSDTAEAAMTPATRRFSKRGRSRARAQVVSAVSPELSRCCERADGKCSPNSRTVSADLQPGQLGGRHQGQQRARRGRPALYRTTVVRKRRWTVAFAKKSFVF